jgi:hypothetical protein
MHYLTSLIVLAGLLFILCLCLIKLSWDLGQVSFHQPPAIAETPGGHAGAKEPPLTEAETFKLDSAELSDAQ